jgi:hypothetical protein
VSVVCIRSSEKDQRENGIRDHFKARGERKGKRKGYIVANKEVKRGNGS